jgi:hypothetical protein
MSIGKIEANIAFFTKISERFTFMLSLSPVDDFSEESRENRRLSDPPAVTIDSVTFLLLDGAVIAAKLA